MDKLGYEGFNPKSVPQKKQVFIEEMGLEILSRTKKTRQPQVNGEFLQYHAPRVPLANAALEFINSEGAISGFLKQYRHHWCQEQKDVYILHPWVRHTGTKTGRMSCADPNLMNVASATTGRRRSDIAMRPRESLGPRPGHYWYLPDYSQIEVWLFAFFSQSEIMLEALLEGADMHGRICKEVWGDKSDFEERYDYYRKCGKLVMFTKLYGGGLKKLAQQLQCTIAEAKVFNALYESRMPDIKPFFTRMQNLVFREGTIQNIYGRYFDIPDHLAYKAVNYLIQGTAAEVLKEAIIATWDYKERYWPAVKILMSLHDEIILEVPKSYHSKELMRGVISCMQQAGEPIGLPIPLKIGMKMVPPGGYWAYAKEVKV
jgi:DNA polymerase-1